MLGDKIGLHMGCVSAPWPGKPTIGIMLHNQLVCNNALPAWKQCHYTMQCSTNTHHSYSMVQHCCITIISWLPLRVLPTTWYPQTTAAAPSGSHRL